jgi:hypothetical protein
MLDFLKNMPDMTNTPEITMIETPKTSISKRIRDYKAANPDATAKQVADAVGTTAVYVYQVLSVPVKKATKTKKVEPVVKEAKENNSVSKKELDALKEEIEMQRLIIDVQKRQAEKLQAVIEYLEGKIDDLGGLVC